LKDTIKGIPPEPNQFFIMNRWLSNEKNNVELCSKLDRFNRGRTNPELLCNLLAVGSDSTKTFIPYVKKKKDDEAELVVELKRYFGMSTYEFSIQRAYMDIQDKTLIKKVAKALGWNKAKCKKFGVEYSTPKVSRLKKEKKSQGKDLFRFK